MKNKRSSRYKYLEVYYECSNSHENDEQLFKLMQMILPRSDIVEIIEREKMENDQSIHVDVPVLNPFDDDAYIPIAELDAFADVHAELGAINVQLD